MAAREILALDEATPQILAPGASDTYVAPRYAAFSKGLGFPDAGELTIATGAVTATGGYHTIDTEADAASDDLDTISGGVDGMVLVIQAEHTDRTVVAKDGTGNLNLQGDYSLDDTDKALTLIYSGALTKWVEVSRVIAIGVDVQAYSANLAALASAGGIAQGTHTIPVLAGAMTARTTSGAASGTSESTTNKVMLRTFDFDAATDEFAQIAIPMPKSWDEGTVTVQFIWTASNTGNVVWGAQGVALGDDDAVDSAFGTAQTVTDGVTLAGDVMESSFTSAITIAGTPAAEDIVVFQFYRDADNGSDTCTVDAQLIGVRIKYTVNAEDDS